MVSIQIKYFFYGRIWDAALDAAIEQLDKDSRFWIDSNNVPWLGQERNIRTGQIDADKYRLVALKKKKQDIGYPYCKGNIFGGWE